MPARSEWKGFLQINQLSVPVKAYSAVKTQPDIVLNQLHRECGERIKQQRICPVHGPVESDAIISGYRVAEGCYLPFDETELEALRCESDKAIKFDCFVDSGEIDPVYHSGRTLYLVPDGPPGQRPFGILREGMQSSARHAVCRVVMSRRELLVLLRPCGALLAMTVLEYPQRVRFASEYEGEVARVVPGSEERVLMARLIESLTDEQFDITRYRDRYVDRLSALIEQRVAEADLTAPAPFRAEEPREAVDDDALVAILKASLSAAGVEEAASNRVREVCRVPASDRAKSEQKLA